MTIVLTAVAVARHSLRTDGGKISNVHCVSVCDERVHVLEHSGRSQSGMRVTRH